MEYLKQQKETKQSQNANNANEKRKNKKAKTSNYTLSLSVPNTLTEKQTSKEVEGRDHLPKPFKSKRKKRKKAKVNKPKQQQEKFSMIDIDEVKERQQYEEQINKQPFEEYAISICNQEHWTAAFTITKIFGKPTRTLADTGASHSVVSLNWVKYLGLEDQIKPSDINMVDAQKRKIPVSGMIELMVEFGGLPHKWLCRVAPNLVCPFIIGVDYMHTGGVNLVDRYVWIGDAKQSITITLGELEQPTVIAATNRVIHPFQYNEIQGKVIKDTQEIENMDPQTYILNCGGVIPIDQLVESKKVKAENAKGISEYVKIRLFNKTGKTMHIRKGSVIATVEEVSKETLASLTDYTIEKAFHNYEILTALFSSNVSETRLLSNTKTPRNNSAHPNAEMANTCNTKGECVPPDNREIRTVGVETEEVESEIMPTPSMFATAKGTEMIDSEIMSTSPLNLATVTCSSCFGKGNHHTTSCKHGEVLESMRADNENTNVRDYPLETNMHKCTQSLTALIGEDPPQSDTPSLHSGHREIPIEGTTVLSKSSSTIPRQKGYQCTENISVDEHYSQPYCGGGGEPWAQAPIPFKTKGGIVCRPVISKNTKTVSELRMEVLSSLAYLQSKQYFETLRHSNNIAKDINSLNSSTVCSTMSEEKVNSKETGSCGSSTVEPASKEVTQSSQVETPLLEDSLKEFIEQHFRNDRNVSSGEDCTEKIKTLIAKAQCDETQRKQLAELLLENKDVFLSSFDKKTFKAGTSFFIPHEIKLKTDKPMWTHQFRQSSKEKEMLSEMTMNQFGQGVVERCVNSPYNSPAMCVPKKDGSWRPVIDYRNINEITIKENWNMTRADEAYDALSKAKYMSVVDCTSGYWQIPLHENSRKYTAFTTSIGRWQYTSLPMGITNAAPTFQRNMEAMLTGLLWDCCIVYIDDIIIYSDTFEEHIQHLREVFKRLKAANVVLKPEKCDFCQPEVEYLGHIIGNGKLKTMPRNIEKVKNCKPPETLTEVRAFCNLVGYYRKFIHKFAQIAKPLTELMSLPGKKKKITLSPEALKAFHTLKDLISQEPVLALPDFNKPFIVRTDASQYAIGGVLIQQDDEGNEKPICYASRTLTRTEQRYSAGEREMLAIYHWIRYWHAYVWGKHFSVYTDHSPLTGIKTKKDISRRLLE